MTIGERCATLSIKTMFLKVIIIVTLMTIILCISACTPKYVIHYIPFDGDCYPLRTTVIRSAENLEEYFSQENYIIKNENYDESITDFTEEFFNDKVLIPILYTEINYIIKSVIIVDNIVTVKMKSKGGNLRPAVAAMLCFLELEKDFVGDATEVNIIYI